MCKAYFNNRLERAGLERAVYFGGVDDYLYLKRHRVPLAELADFEVMTYSVFDDQGCLVEGQATELILRDLMVKLDSQASAQSYAGVKYT